MTPDRCTQLADDVSFGAHFGGSPLRIGAIIHREAVMVLGDRHYKRSTSLLEQGRPFLGIELFCCELRNEILIAELVWGTIGLKMMLIYLGAFSVHVAGIPLCTEGWHGIYAPMDKDPELRILIPAGNGI
ncbi:hypothetical protein D3C81_1716850 [compost metagenome]